MVIIATKYEAKRRLRVIRFILRLPGDTTVPSVKATANFMGSGAG